MDKISKNISINPDFIKQILQAQEWLTQNRHISSGNHETIIEEKKIKDITDFYDKLEVDIKIGAKKPKTKI